MSSLSEAFGSYNKSLRDEEKSDPKVLDTWKAVVPTAVEGGVTAATGSHTAGRAAQGATRVAMSHDSGFADEAASTLRSVAHAGALTAVSIPAVLIGAPILVGYWIFKKLTG